MQIPTHRTTPSAFRVEAAEMALHAVGLGKEIKELDLGIGFFSIAFQSDDLTLKALSGVSDLSAQDASEITTDTV